MEISLALTPLLLQVAAVPPSPAAGVGEVAPCPVQRAGGREPLVPGAGFAAGCGSSSLAEEVVRGVTQLSPPALLPEEPLPDAGG